MEKKNAFQIVTEKVMETLKKEKVLPWDSGLLNKKMVPMNWVSQKNYRGGNRIILMILGNLLLGENAKMEFATYKQWQEKGGQVKKGAKGFPILFFSQYDKKRKCRADKDSDKEDVIPIWKYSTVFDISQVEGEIKPRREIKSIPHTPNGELDSVIATFARNTSLKMELTKVAGSGFYQPSKHLVSVASLSSYKTADAYYSTIFHECIHSTAKALGRKIEGSLFGSHDYSEEEIVAELGAMFLCQYFGINKETERNSSEYLRSWSMKLQDNPDWLLKGASAAQKAVDYFLEKAECVTDEEKEAA